MTFSMSRRARFWLIAIAIWTLCPILMAVQAAFSAIYAGNAVEWGRLLPIRLVDWYSCALFTPVCFWLVRRFPLQRGARVRNLAVQFVVISIVVALKFAIFVEVARYLFPAEPWRFDQMLVRGFVSESIAFWCLLALVYAIEYHRRLRERELQAARLETELASARLDALTAQLQPHFLFNTLHSISTLMRRDVEAADEMLTHLGDLLHRTLRQGGRHEVTLAEELELLRHYTDIMKIRFQDRLAVRVDVDESVLPALVPNLVLQPLVENAIRHGISRKPGAGLLEIAARRDGATLEISVRDDGEGLSGAEEGVGLSNTRRRLRQLYGEAQSLELVPGGEGGLMVRMRLPMRTAA